GVRGGRNARGSAEADQTGRPSPTRGAACADRSAAWRRGSTRGRSGWPPRRGRVEACSCADRDRAGHQPPPHPLERPAPGEEEQAKPDEARRPSKLVHHVREVEEEDGDREAGDAEVDALTTH